jgi:hypothetical protein
MRYNLELKTITTGITIVPYFLEQQIEIELFGEHYCVSYLGFRLVACFHYEH